MNGVLKIATWNVNSIKIRLEQVLEWLEHSQTDILAVQETKMIDEQFPAQIFIERGYHIVFSGQKSYNGVAIISKFPLSNVVKDIADFEDPQRRVLAATTGDIRLINLYVPNGSAVGSDKYAYKLKWLEKVIAYIKEELSKNSKLAVVGDFNIAPEDRDVHDPGVWVGNVMVSAEERKAFSSLLDLGLKDSFRSFCQDSIFSWWDYRQGCFRRNMGLRIDHILLSEVLTNQCTHCEIDIAPRRAKRPSDHAPVIATF
ncbi:exodeoxyribonuclease III (plasmid) [Legionella adelaidensis]|uniref:Exodeoxyribonuclease III n=1 Tax=Legionella adelaidensis TaxID=45056 RepID=A0A0W0R695_9GAMM|nr:exodeoxyribonuclease III [Legionella adelaidensis]VEH85502.1 exodeoxyribonuclease III [Legionella adelaidensis]